MDKCRRYCVDNLPYCCVLLNLPIGGSMVLLLLLLLLLQQNGSTSFACLYALLHALSRISDTYKDINTHTHLSSPCLTLAPTFLAPGIHRDVKPANLLLDLPRCGLLAYTPSQPQSEYARQVLHSKLPLSFQTVKLCGTDVSYSDGLAATPQLFGVGTPRYMAPELEVDQLGEPMLAQGSRHSAAVDIFSLGVTVAELV